MAWARDASGIGTQPKANSSDFDASFFVVFNFCGTIFIMTLFASVMVRNYTEATGVAYLTREQRAWTKQRKMLQRIRPSQNPLSLNKCSLLRAWLLKRAGEKSGRWHKAIIIILIFHLAILCIEFPSAIPWLEKTKSKYLILRQPFNITDYEKISS